MGVDERLREGLARIPPADPGGAYERIVEKKVHRRVLRKLQAAALAVVVIAGSGVGFVALSRAFRPTGTPLAAGEAANGRIIFSGGDDRDVFTVNPDGSDLRNLTNTPGIEEDYPNVSPDGTRIAYCQIAETSEAELEGGIWVMDIDGGNKTQLTDGGNGECYPTWSPDGRRIAFQSDRDGQPGMNIYAMDADGSDIVRLTSGDADQDWYPAWSPAGDWIAFHRTDGSSPDADIFLVAPDGTGLQRITDAPGLDMTPNWSPDGREIVFMTDRFVADPDSYPPVVAVMGADGSNVRQLTTGGDGYSEADPFWSPDGTRIGFQRFGAGGGSLITIARDGSGEDLVLSPVSTDACCLHPSWQPVFTDVASPTSSPTEEATPSVTPTVGQDIGLRYPVCDVTSVRGRFGAPGTEGTAFLGSVVEDGRCPQLQRAEQVLAVDLDGDDLADLSFEDLDCEEWCHAWTAPDIDGDGTDEILVQNVQFSVAGLHLYDMVGEPPRIVAVTVAPPGDPGTFEPGEQPQLWYGGDGFGSDGLDCVGAGSARVLVSSAANQDPPESGPWYVHETTFRLVDGTLEVIGVRDYQTDEPGLIDSDDTGICGARNPYWGR